VWNKNHVAGCVATEFAVRSQGLIEPEDKLPANLLEQQDGRMLDKMIFIVWMHLR